MTSQFHFFRIACQCVGLLREWSERGLTRRLEHCTGLNIPKLLLRIGIPNQSAHCPPSLHPLNKEDYLLNGFTTSDEKWRMIVQSSSSKDNHVYIHDMLSGSESYQSAFIFCFINLKLKSLFPCVFHDYRDSVLDSSSESFYVSGLLSIWINAVDFASLDVGVE